MVIRGGDRDPECLVGQNDQGRLCDVYVGQPGDLAAADEFVFRTRRTRACFLDQSLCLRRGGGG